MLFGDLMNSYQSVAVKSTIDEYLEQRDWRVNANANQGYSLGGLILNVSGKVIANYWRVKPIFRVLILSVLIRYLFNNR